MPVACSADTSQGCLIAASARYDSQDPEQKEVQTTYRRRTSVCVVAVAVVVSALSAASAGAQNAPRTAWGQPDLQGVWDFRSITPLQRPEELEGREFLTEEEAAELEQGAVNRDIRLSEAAPRRTEAGGNVGGYNNFWIDRGLKAVETRRTSLITYPPNGRMPSLIPSAERRATERREHLNENPAGSWLDFGSGERCILGFNAGPPFTPSFYNNMQLFQTPDHVVIMTEMVNTARVIPLDGRPHLDPDVLQWSGDSRGY